MNSLAVLSTRKPYLLWTVASGAVLFAAHGVDPYVFGFATLASAWVSGAVVLGAVIWGRRQLLWALLSVIPSASGFLLLSTFKWA